MSLVKGLTDIQKKRSFIAGLGTSNTIRAYKIGKKDETNIQITQAAVQDFPQVIFQLHCTFSNKCLTI